MQARTIEPEKAAAIKVQFTSKSGKDGERRIRFSIPEIKTPEARQRLCELLAEQHDIVQKAEYSRGLLVVVISERTLTRESAREAWRKRLVTSMTDLVRNAVSSVLQG